MTDLEDKTMRWRFVLFVLACVLGSYLYLPLAKESSSLPFMWELWSRAIQTYGNLWFSRSVGWLFWIITHTLFALSAWWWLRCGELRILFFLFLTGLSISSMGAAFQRIMIVYYTYHPFP